MWRSTISRPGSSARSATWSARNQHRWLRRAWLARVVALSAVGCSGGGSPGQAPLAGYDLILVVVDTLRADHLGAYGYDRVTSPTIDRLAREGVVFDAAVSTSSYTRESVASLLSGRFPWRSGSVGWFARPNLKGPHLGGIFRRAVYRTGFFSNTVQLRAPGFTRGFDQIQHLPTRWDTSGEGPKLSARALNFVKASFGKPVFLYLHYLDPHAPYRAAPQRKPRFTPAPFERPLAIHEDVVPGIGRLVRSGFGPGDPRFDDLVARYDAEIAATDEALAALLRGLERLGRRERTLIVLTSDHGEEFLEHGFVEHSWTVYQESIHVPLIFWADGALAPARVPERVSLVDVLPSILGLVGVESDAPDGLVDGVSLFEPGSGRPRAVSRPHFAELLVAERNAVRAVILDDWKYMAYHRWSEPEARHDLEPIPVDLSSLPLREELYHLAEDPGELRDRSSEFPERVESFRAMLRKYTESAGPWMAPAGQPATPIPPQMRERLEALGYSQDE